MRRLHHELLTILDLRVQFFDLVFLSDHGYQLGEHTLWAKTSCFEYDAHVPLMISTPTLQSGGKVTNALAELVDLFPTLTELAGVKPPAGLDGVSLAPILRDPTTTVKSAAFTQHPRPAYPDRTATGKPDAMGYSVRTANARYTEWRDWTTGKVLAAEYYDHEHDPTELVNRVADVQDQENYKNARAALHKQFPPEVPPSQR